MIFFLLSGFREHCRGQVGQKPCKNPFRTLKATKQSNWLSTFWARMEQYLSFSHSPQCRPRRCSDNLKDAASRFWSDATGRLSSPCSTRLAEGCAHVSLQYKTHNLYRSRTSVPLLCFSSSLSKQKMPSSKRGREATVERTIST